MNAAVYDSSAVDAYIQEQTKREQEITRTRKIENFAKEAPYLLLLWGGRLLAVGLLILCIGYAIKLALSWHHIDETIISGSKPSVYNGYQKDEFTQEDVLVDVEGILERGNFNNHENGSISSQTNGGIESSLPIISTQEENIQDTSELTSGITNSEITNTIPERSISQAHDQAASIEESQALASNEATKNSSEEIENNLAPPDENTIRKYTVFDRIPFNGDVIDTVVVGRRFDEPGGPIVGKYCYIKVPNSKGIYESVYFIRDNSEGRNELPITQTLSKDLRIDQQELLAAKSKCKI
jgi:hypothetical protein